MRHQTEGGRVLNFRRALHTYEAQRYYVPRSRWFLPNEVEIDISGIGRFDQGNQGSCTGNAWANLWDVRQTQHPGNDHVRFHTDFWPAARDYIYRKETELDGNPGQDRGSYLHTGANVVANIGCVSEKVLPYGFDALMNPPSEQIETWAKYHRLSSAFPVMNNPTAIMATLNDGNPIVFGMPVYPEFERLNAQNYIVTMPSYFERPLGGHANMIYGYVTMNGMRYYKGLNSWGAAWGNNGTYLVPEPFVLRFFSDLWTALP